MQAIRQGELNPHRADILVATAMEDEYNALARLLPNSKIVAPDTIVDIQRSNKSGSYRLSIVITGQSTAFAATAIKDAIARCRPRIVVLVGIAAGFPESGVSLGDVLVPFSIVPYELAKIRQVNTSQTVIANDNLFSASDMAKTAYEHRGVPYDVSHPLWMTAEAINHDPSRPWIGRITAQRPPSSISAPRVHLDRRFKLGSGDKLVASEFAEAREWLRAKYGSEAIGLEMEAFGAIVACRTSDLPFLVIKASQDPATAVKDAPAEKDLWRTYAAEAAAAFALTIIENHTLPANSDVPALVEERELPSRAHEPRAGTTITSSSSLRPANEHLRFLLERNFLFDFDHSGNPDYASLIGADFRNLFFHFWNGSLTLCVSGNEGCGKTFCTLVVTQQLTKAGYTVFYGSVRDADIKRAALTDIAEIASHPVLLIDDCQDDLDKTRDIIDDLERLRGRRLRVIFLTRPLGSHEHTETFGHIIPTIQFRDSFIDLRHLAQLFFAKIGQAHQFSQFDEELSKETLSRELWGYRNMEFWNTYFNTMAHTSHFTFNRGRFYTLAYSYLSDKEPQLVTSSSPLVTLLPFFANGMPVLREWAQRTAGITDEHVATLISSGLAQERLLNWDNIATWENDTAGFICQLIYPTKARIALTVGAKYGINFADEIVTLTEYAAAMMPNLYYIMGSLIYGAPSTYRRLLTSEKFIAVLRGYLISRHPGKQLDRVITRLSRSDGRVASELIDDDDVRKALLLKLNSDRAYVVSKALLLRSIYRVDPATALRLYEMMDMVKVAEDFVSGRRGANLHALTKLIETLKNLLYDALEAGKGKEIFDRISGLLDDCASGILRAVDEAPFAELHWLMKRLQQISWPPKGGVQLGCKVLSSMPPPDLVRWISSKDVRLLELRYVIDAARRIRLGAEYNDQLLYPDYLIHQVSSDSLYRIISSPRTKVFDIVSMVGFAHEMLAGPLLIYARDGGLGSNVHDDMDIGSINACIAYFAGGRRRRFWSASFSDSEIGFLVRTIIDNAAIDQRKIAATERRAKRAGRPLDIKEELEHFARYSRDYGSGLGNSG